MGIKKMIGLALLIAMFAAVSIAFAADAAPATVQIHIEHKDQDTDETLLVNDYEVPPGQYGPYTPDTFAGYGPGELDPDSFPAVGEANSYEGVSIVFQYEKLLDPTKGNVIVAHRDADSGAIQKAFWETVAPGAYGPYSAETFADYQNARLADDSDPVSGTVQAGAVVRITYLYDKIPEPDPDPDPTMGTITVEHRDAETGELLMESFTEEVEPGEYGPYNSDIFPGYFQSGWLPEDSAPPYGTIEAGETIAITYLYERNWEGKAVIWVTYREAGTNQWLDADRYEIEAGAYGPFEPKEIEGYGVGVWDENTTPVEGIIEADEVLGIAFVCEKDGEAPESWAIIEVIHKDVETNEILWIDSDLNVPVGPYGPYLPFAPGEIPDHPGYGEGVWYLYSDMTEGEITENDLDRRYYIVFEYLKQPEPGEAFIYVSHSYEGTLELIEMSKQVVPAGEYGPYTGEHPYFPEPGVWDETSAPVSGAIGDGEIITIGFLHDSNVLPGSRVIVEHRDQDTWELLDSSEELLAADATEYGGPDNLIAPIDIDGYGPGVWDAYSDPESGGIQTFCVVVVRYLYEKINDPTIPTSATIIIEHRDAKTYELISEFSETVEPGEYGPYSPSLIPGYYQNGWRADDSSPASGIIEAGDIAVITFFYEPNPEGKALIWVLHKDAETLEWIEADLLEVDPGEYGPYEAKPIEGYGPGIWDDATDFTTGTAEPDQVLNVSFLYEKLSDPEPGKGTIIVQYLDRVTGEAIKEEDVFAVNPGVYGPYPPLEFGGYQGGTLAADSAPMDGYIEEGETKTIIYLYSADGDAIETTVTVRHLQLDDMETVIEEGTHCIAFEPGMVLASYGPFEPKEFAGYGAGELWSGSAPAGGTIAFGDSRVVTYLYEKLPVMTTIIVKYLDRETGEPLKDEDRYFIEPGQYGPYPPLEFDGYQQGTLAAGSDPMSGMIGEGVTKTITYLYSFVDEVLQTAVTVRHVQKDNPGVVLEEETYVIPFESGSVIANYGPYGAKTFPGFRAGEIMPGSDPAGGTITFGSTKVVTYLYEKILKSTVYVVHKDRDTGAVLKADTHYIDAGEYGPYNATIITGYGAGTRAANSAQASGTIIGGQTLTVTYLYSYTLGKATVYVVHKDRETGAVLKRDTVIVDGGFYGPYGATTFSGYSPGYLAANSNPASGPIVGGQALTITYLYTGKATVYVVHKDRGTGVVLRADTYHIYAGAYGPYEGTEFAGYGPGLRASNSAPKEGEASAGQSVTITYLYTPVPLIAPEDDGTEEDEFNFVEDNSETGDEGEVDELPTDGGDTETGTETEGEGGDDEFPTDGDDTETESEGEGEVDEFPTDGDDTETDGEDECVCEDDEFPTDGDHTETDGDGECEADETPSDEEKCDNDPTFNDEGTDSDEEAVQAMATIIVLHKDNETEEILLEERIAVAAGLYGPFDACEITGYVPGVLDASSAPASGNIDVGDTKFIIYLYSRSVEVVPAKGPYNVEVVIDEPEFMFVEDAGSGETGFLFE